MAWKKPVRETIEDLENAIALAVSINVMAADLWVHSCRDERLQAIAKDSKKIQENVSQVNRRLIALFAQQTLPSMEPHEPNRSLGPKARRRMEAGEDV